MEVEQKFYVDKQSGAFLGSVAGKAGSLKAPRNSVEVPSAPKNAKDTWDGSKWVEYDSTKEDAEQKLIDTDKNMARVAEDIIDLLVSKGVITEEDLPSNVTEIISERKDARTKLSAKPVKKKKKKGKKK